MYAFDCFWGVLLATTSAVEMAIRQPPFFPDIPAIPFKGAESKDVLAYKYYNVSHRLASHAHLAPRLQLIRPSLVHSCDGNVCASGQRGGDGAAHEGLAPLLRLLLAHLQVACGRSMS